MAMGCLKFPTFLCQAVRVGVASKSPRASLVINTSFSRCVAHSCALRIQNGRGPFLANIFRPTIATKRHGFCNRATPVSDAGSVDSSLMESMQNKIKEQLNAEVVVVKDAYGDGRHVMIEVVSSAFEGQSQVNRQRMVYKAIWEELQSAVHAVDYMVTKTPSEASQ